MEEVAPILVSIRTAGDIPRVYDAVAAYEHDPSRPTPRLVIEFPGGVIEERFSLQLGEVDDPHLFDITIAGNGSTLLDGAISIAGTRINISNLVLDGQRTNGRPLDLAAREALTLEHVAIVNLRPEGTSGGSRPQRGANLHSIGPAAALLVRDSLFLDNQHSVDISGFNTGQGFASARFERVRFAGNVSPAFYFGRVDRLEFVDSTRLGGAGDFAQTTARTVVLSEPTERPADDVTLAAWRAELARWGTAP